jgi:hypothetical protein
MSEWNDVKEQLPPSCNKGVDDCITVLAVIDSGYYKPEYKLVIWMNNRFCGFPAGNTDVTHWMHLPNLPEAE